MRVNRRQLRSLLLYLCYVRYIVHGVYVPCIDMHARWELTVGNSGPCCCTCDTYFECQLTPLCADSAWEPWALFCSRFFFSSRKLAVHTLTWITVIFVDFTLTALVTHGAHARVGTLRVDALPSISAGGTLGTLIDVHVTQSACQQMEYVLLLSLPAHSTHRVPANKWSTFFYLSLPAHSTKTLNLGVFFSPLLTQDAATDR